MSSIPIKQKYKKRIRLKRKGQSEIIGGLIVLTLLFAFAVPLMINIYYSTIQTSEQAQQAFQQLRTQYNEKVTVTPLDPNNEAYIRAGWIPGVFINNTGTTQVTLVKLYLLDTKSNNIYTILDLRYARPDPVTPLIKDMLVNVTVPGTGQPPPPPGQPITLMPGESLLIAFNESILPFASNLVVLVESSTGVIHPIIGQGGAEQLYPGRGAGAGTGVGEGAWRGIFSPQSGFLLISASDLERFSSIWGERPCYYVGSYYYNTGWAYDNDPSYPPFYRIQILSYRDTYRGFLGTFDISSYDSNDVLVEGWYMTDGYTDACYYKFTSDGVYEVYPDLGLTYKIRSGNYLRYFQATGDMDRNGVPEIIFYTNWISYYPGTYGNPDSDLDGSRWSDSLVMYVQASRDISGVDYIKISAKLIYDLSISGDGEPNIPLKVFSLAVWEYDSINGTWILYTTKDYDFVNNGPKTFVVSGTFPVNRSKTYRIGIIFYDPIKETYSGAEYEFMIGLEHLIVEYGILNPLFIESPPLYIIAIQDPNYISEIGEVDLANAYNITDLNTAKLLAQKTLLNKIEEELNYAGVSGYTIITNSTDACNLLFSSTPPKYAVIYWLQGAVPLSDVLPCLTSEEDALQYIIDNHWILVSPFGTPFGGETYLQSYNSELSLLPEGNYTANITDIGIEYRQKAYAFYLFNKVQFKTLAYLSPAFSYLYVENGTFYTNTSGLVEYYGTSSFWVYNPLVGGGEGSGMIVINPVHIDWDYTRDGAVVDTVVQQTVYSSLSAWRYLVSNY